MRLEEVAQFLFLCVLFLAAVLWFSVEHWEPVVAPALQTIGALARLFRVPIFVCLAVVMGFLLFRLNGPRG